jgi:hypothetical protein
MYLTSCILNGGWLLSRGSRKEPSSRETDRAIPREYCEWINPLSSSWASALSCILRRLKGSDEGELECLHLGISGGMSIPSKIGSSGCFEVGDILLTLLISGFCVFVCATGSRIYLTSCILKEGRLLIEGSTTEPSSGEGDSVVVQGERCEYCELLGIRELSSLRLL